MNDPVKKPDKKTLPIHAKASGALAREAVYAGLLPVARLERLSAAVAGPSGDLDIEFKIRRDANRAPKLEGRIRGGLQMVCQRCLRRFAWPLDLAVDLRLVFNEDEENRVLKDAEPYLVSEDMLMFHAIAEEEVLLALPYAPRCEQDDCEPG
ncbi:MAG: YceD family protein [Nevskia sp.]